MSNLSEKNSLNKNDTKPSAIKNYFKGFLFNIKRIKHLDKLLVVLFVVVILLIYFSTFDLKKNSSSTSEKTSQTQDSYYTYSVESMTLGAYKEVLEQRLEKTLSCIKNAGNVTVITNFNGGIEEVIAYTTTSQIDENGKSVETKTPVLITTDGQAKPVVLERIMPSPSNIVVIASGAGNTNVKLEIQRAVQALFGLPSSKIEIFVGN